MNYLDNYIEIGVTDSGEKIYVKALEEDENRYTVKIVGENSLTVIGNCEINREVITADERIKPIEFGRYTLPVEELEAEGELS